MIYLKNIMQVIVVSLTLSTVISTRSGIKKLNRMNYVAHAIKEIMFTHSSEQNLMRLDVAVYGNDKKLQFLAQEIIKTFANGSHSVNLEQKSLLEKILLNCGQAPKIILASGEFDIDTKEIKRMEREEDFFHQKHDSLMIFYYLNESNVRVFTKTLYTLSPHMMQRALFIGHTADRDSNDLMLYGYVKYSNCEKDVNNVLYLILRNTFIASSMKWTNQTFKHEYKNFNGCPLIVLAYDEQDCSLKYETNEKGEIVGLGFPYGRLIHLYAEKHNAKLQVEPDESVGSYLPIDLVLLQTKKSGSISDGKYKFTPTVAIDEYKISFLIIRGRRFTPLEKLLLPFDSATWCLNIFTILVGYLVILILYQMPTYIQKFVFGAYNRDPSLGLSQIFFGMGLVQTPRRNFARFIFMMFTIFCLIIRTAYQSKMYDFLQYDERQPTMKTVKEIMQQNVSLVPWNMYLADELEKELFRGNATKQYTLLFNSFNGSLHAQSYLIDFDQDEEEDAYGAVIDRADYKCIEMHDPVEYRRIQQNMRMTDDDFVSGLNHWYILKPSVVHNSLNKFLLECHQHGIISYIMKADFREKFLPEEETTKVLTMHMLSAGFYVWLASMGIGFIVFILEQVHKRVTQHCV